MRSKRPAVYSLPLGHPYRDVCALQTMVFTPAQITVQFPPPLFKNSNRLRCCLHEVHKIKLNPRHKRKRHSERITTLRTDLIKSNCAQCKCIQTYLRTQATELVRISLLFAETSSLTFFTTACSSAI